MPSSRAGAPVASRRLLADGIALIFAARRVTGTLAGLPELDVRPLGRDDARALLESALPTRLDDCVLERGPLERLTADGELMAYRHDGFFFAMDTFREYQYLNELWASGNAPWKRRWPRRPRNFTGIPAT